MKRLTFLIILFSPGAAFGDAEIQWESELDEVNLQSDGVTPMDESFVFFLGAFEGLVPDATNLGDWEGAFRVLDSTVYRPADGGFLGETILTQNLPPFTAGGQAYVWGRNGTSPGSEWILFGRSTWTWPVANTIGIPPLPRSWIVSGLSAEDVVLGTVNQGGVQMQTEVASFPLSYEIWSATVFQKGDDSSQDADPDEDGRSNFLEYALGSDPKEADGPFEVAFIDGRDLEVFRAPNREVEWVVEESTDLVSFGARMDGITLVVDEPDRLLFRIEGPAQGKRFFRISARPVD